MKLNVKANAKSDITPVVLLIAVFSIAFIALYYFMAASFPGLIGDYFSDIRARIDQGLGDPYSIFLKPEYFFYNSFGKGLGALLIGVYLSFFVVGSVILVYFLLKRLCSEASKKALLLAALSSLFMVSICIPYLKDGIYDAYTGSVWHNETYLGMRFFAMLFLIVFYDTCENYLERFSLKTFICESVLLLFVNWVKPNFIIAFGPAMLVMMIVDIIKARGKGFVNWILYGVPVLIGALILPFQFLNLFSNTVETSDSSIIFVPGTPILDQRFPIIVFLCAYAFPIISFFIHYKEVFKSKFLSVSYLGWVFSLLEYAFLAETGSRSSHGNFSWGLHFFTFLIFVISIALHLKERYTMNVNDKKAVILYKVSRAIAGLHLVCGIGYFILVMLGACGYMV